MGKKGSAVVFAEYMMRSSGLKLYETEIKTFFIKTSPDLEAHINGFFKKINSSLQSFYPLAQDYFIYLIKDMGFSYDSASEMTFNIFQKPIEQFVEIYYDLFEIEHYMYLLKHPKLVIGGAPAPASGLAAAAQNTGQSLQQGLQQAVSGQQQPAPQPSVSSGQTI